jgi:site-specific DNA-methyltransferase (adenine-specific)
MKAKDPVGDRLLVGNCLETLKTLADASIDSIVTDPPYELGFMGKSWDASGIAYQVELWAECLRVLKPGGHLLAFGGTRTYHRMAVAIEDAGFEIRDSIHWTYGSGFPKSLNVSKALTKNKQTDAAKRWDGWGTALKPSHEPIVVARKPLVGTVADNVQQHGTGAINIDATRVGSETITIKGQGNDKMFHGNFSGEVDNPTRTGRFPANTLLTHNHDCDTTCTPSCPVELLDQQSGIRPGGTWNTTSGARHFNNDGDPTNYQTSKTDNTAGGASRFFHNSQWSQADDLTPFIYQAKPGKKERNAGLDSLPEQRPDERTESGMGTFDEKGVAKQSNFHPTVKPVELIRYLIRMITPPKGTVLDPFLGSGTTAVAAILEGTEWKGCELTKDYLPIIKGRIAWATKQAKKPATPKKTSKPTVQADQLPLVEPGGSDTF